MLHEQRVNAGQAQEKRKYVYYDQLSFLLPNVVLRNKNFAFDPPSIDSNEPTEQNDSNMDDFDEIIEEIEFEDNGDVEEGSVILEENVEIENWVFTPNMDEDENSYEDSDETSEADIYDEDVSFAEMLVPMLKKLNDYQKYYAKKKILNALYKAATRDEDEEME